MLRLFDGYYDCNMIYHEWDYRDCDDVLLTMQSHYSICCSLCLSLHNVVLPEILRRLQSGRFWFAMSQTQI